MDALEYAGGLELSEVAPDGDLRYAQLMCELSDADPLGDGQHLQDLGLPLHGQIIHQDDRLEVRLAHLIMR